jgi:hypothetical protein
MMERPQEDGPRASTVPPGLNDTPEKRRLLRLLTRLDRSKLTLLSRLVGFLLPDK